MTAVTGIAGKLLVRWGVRSRSLQEYMMEGSLLELSTLDIAQKAVPRTFFRLLAKAERGQRKELQKREAARLRREAKLAVNF